MADQCFYLKTLIVRMTKCQYMDDVTKFCIFGGNRQKNINLNKESCNKCLRTFPLRSSSYIKSKSKKKLLPAQNHVNKINSGMSNTHRLYQQLDHKQSHVI